MKNFFLFALLIGSAIVSLSPHNENKIRNNEENERPEVSDQFLNQRIYPEGKINYEYYNQALEEAKNMNAASRFNPSVTALPAWQFAGPTNIGGRVTSITMHSSSQQIIYVGSATGGVFKSTNQGTTWNPIFDANPSLSIGDIAIAPSNANILFVGTGEPNNGRGSVTYDGQGIFKSIDAGVTWTSVGLANTRNTGRIAIHPTNPNIVLAATMGDLFATGPNRGVYRTIDGGLTWTQTLYVNDSTGAMDICIDPSNPNNVYASTWTRIRRPMVYNYGGTGSNVYKSTDGGVTWTMLTNGLPANSPNSGRINITISASTPNTLYAGYSDPVGAFIGMYKTTNGGTSWAPISGNNFLLSNLTSTQYFWGGRIVVDPSNNNTLYIADFSMWKSTNGGNTWSDIGQSYHVDHHITYVHPANGNLVLEGTDGGFFKSTNGGTSWSTNQTLPISQFYTCEVDNQNPTHLYGGLQDNGTVYTPTGNTNNWQSVFGGDGFVVKINPANTLDQIYEYQYGSLSTNMTGINQSETSAWNSPIELNALNGRSIYVGRKSVYKSNNFGNSWNAISPDLSQGPTTGNLVFHCVTTISSCKADTNVIWAGCDDGNVQVTTNGGTTWTNVSAGLPVRWITRLTADAILPARAFVCVSGYRWHEYVPHILMTNNYGVTWTDISSNLPQAPCNDVIVDPTNNNVLYAATDLGVFYSTNLGASWQTCGTGLPGVMTTDLSLHNPTRTLVVATYGRSMWKLDLNQLTGADPIAQAENNISVFPNPVNDHFNVIGAKENSFLSIFSADGKLVLTKELKSENEHIERGDLASGIYFYSVTIGKEKSGVLRKGKLIFE